MTDTDHWMAINTMAVNIHYKRWLKYFRMNQLWNEDTTYGVSQHSRRSWQPTPGDLCDLGIKLMSLMSPALAGGFFTTSATWEAPLCIYISFNLLDNTMRSASPFCLIDVKKTQRG